MRAYSISRGYGSRPSHSVTTAAPSRIAAQKTVEPPQTFAFRWILRDGAEPADGSSTLVVMTLTPTETGTRVTVVESGFRGPLLV